MPDPAVQFLRRTRLPVPAAAAFAWHARPGAFQRLVPPWEAVEVVAWTGGIGEGDRMVLALRAGPFRQWWVAELGDHRPGRQFRDVQRSGPFAAWDHLHRFEPDGPAACILEDRIAYTMPFGTLGRLLAGRFVARKLERMFAYRHRVTALDLAAHQRCIRQTGGQAMKILVSGATGLVGSALVPFLKAGGHTVAPLVRPLGAAGPTGVRWDPGTGTIDRANLEGFDAVVHLAGENVASGRWTAERKRRIRDSRVEGTRLLAEALAGLERPPKVLVCASAIGYYGDRNVEVLTEASPSGGGFLPAVCREWEAAADPARAKGIRVVHLRFGVILSPRGGALARMLLPFRMGAGGVLGDGRQYLSWIDLDDAAGAIHHALMTEALAGPVNGVAPHPVTNREFTRTLGTVLGRPTVFPMPAVAARLAFGEMADALLLASTRVQPARLLETGYPFRHPHLEDSLRHQLGRSLPGA